MRLLDLYLCVVHSNVLFGPSLALLPYHVQTTKELPAAKEAAAAGNPLKGFPTGNHMALNLLTYPLLSTLYYIGLNKSRS